jgi:nucleoside-diphosphate-sugar epimerase
LSRVVVTGGSGKLGRAVVQELVDHRYEVVNIDAVPPREPICPFTKADLTDHGQAVEALLGVDDRYKGVDAVVHLAAFPAPGIVTNAATFANNMMCSFNVFSAARVVGVRNVVWASSETTLGIPFATPPPYIPVDEDYPARPETTYALVKHLEEQIALQFCRWDPQLKMIGLRFSNVMEPEDYKQFPSFDADPALRSWNLWGYIDARDGAQAVRRALEYDFAGTDVFIIANADTVMSRPSAELASEVFPGVPLARALHGTETMLSIEKARRLLGYEPVHSWRDSVD